MMVSAPPRGGGSEDAPIVRVHLSGLLRGAELSGEALLRVAPPNVELQVARRLIVLRIASIDGVELRHDAVFIHLRWGDVLEARSTEPFDAFVAAVTREALALPELTASLRSYGSARAGAGDAQESFFAPLRQALVAAATGRTEGAGATAFAAERLIRDLEAQLAQLARAHFPAHPPERRALEADLSDCTAAMIRRLDALAEAEAALHGAPARERFTAWRRWSDALVDVFSAHDACWPLVRAALDAATLPPEEPRGRWSPWRQFGVPRARGEEP